MLILEPITVSRWMEHSDWPGLGHVLIPGPGTVRLARVSRSKMGRLVSHPFLRAGLSQLQEHHHRTLV